DLMNQIQGDVNRQAKELGVEIVDLRMTRVDLPAQNSTAVYRRMTTERNREAADIRANGDQIAATIKAKADRFTSSWIWFIRRVRSVLTMASRVERARTLRRDELVKLARRWLASATLFTDW
ncbi:MAG: hypothetical protein EOO66_31140, partial [Methylobacterium sp.]